MRKPNEAELAYDDEGYIWVGINNGWKPVESDHNPRKQVHISNVSKETLRFVFPLFPENKEVS